MTMRDDVSALESVDLERLAEIARRFAVAELFAFGSAARGNDTEDGDIDLLYVLEPDARRRAVGSLS